MRKSVVMLPAASALVWGSMAFATNNQSAFAGAEANAEDAENSIVVSGAGSSTQQVVGALAIDQAIATFGEDNEIEVKSGNFVEGDGVAGTRNEVLIVDQEDAGYAAVVGENAQITIVNNKIEGEVEEGSAAVAGSENCVDVNYVKTEIDGTIEGGRDGKNGGMTTFSGNKDGKSENEASAGVIAKEADVACSFNVEQVCLEVEIDIEDSFNVETNTLDISGQCGASVIINANSLDDQEIGTNLNVTNATASGPATVLEESGSALCAFARSGLTQAVVNSSLIIPIGAGSPGVF